jgi:hypothetical protein
VTPIKPDIISAIDSVTGCQQCGKDLTGSVSDDYCSEECQRAWQAANVARAQQGHADVGIWPLSTTQWSELAIRLDEIPRPVPLADMSRPPRFEVGGTMQIEGIAQVFRYDGMNWLPITSGFTIEEPR